MSVRDRIVAGTDEQQPLLTLVWKSKGNDLGYAGVGIVTSFVAQSLSSLDMFIIGLAFDAVFNDQAYTIPLFPNGWIPGNPTQQLVFTVALLTGIKLVDLGFGICSEWAFSLFAQRLLHRIRVDAFDTVQRLNMNFFDRHQTGDVMSVLNSDVNALERFLEFGPSLATTGLTILVSSLVYMALLNWQLMLISLTIAPVLFAINSWFGNRHEIRNDDVREETGRLNALLETNISGIQVVKAFSGERHETQRVSNLSDRHRVVNWHAHLVNVRHQPSMRLLAGAAFIVTLFIGTEWVIDGEFWVFSGTLTAGELIPFMYYTQALVRPVRFAAWFTGLYKGATSAAKRILSVQRMNPSRDEEKTDFINPDGHITYNNVSFSYPGTDEPVIHDINIEIEPGETVGFVGETGAGKSTLLKFLFAFYDPDDGTVRVDSTDVRDLSRTSLRRSIGYVAQDPFLFTGTIRENITYGVDETADDTIVAAAKAAGAHEFVSQLDDGYDAQVGERGVTLSGGQRQRLAIARVLLADPPMFVFDEATSHVDNRTEVLIQRSLDEVTADRTTLVVAHRLSTVRNTDRIVVLDSGEIIEQGTHEELLDRDGTYADLWNVQVGAVSE
ncbi:ABC transporter ATP-binding protein [Halocatena salina]|uniref:ABC transporter ATP-binding protein/permease n=1 Tax=Halocatena salina TaxID=2934340 RepID=A0A8U0ABG1_9EURY|nr:ABC transporter ATP-binding protein [Halocatena salina]UPM45213.1 ABC transporter ATP-binding protein/permease [Halocatena salina]